MAIKLDKSIFQTNIMALTPKTFKVWIALLASCDDDGVARVSPTYLSRICYLSVKDVEKSLNTLSIPVYRERKIIKVDAGYAVVDYKKYRVE